MKQKPEKPFPALLVGASGKYNLWNHGGGAFLCILRVGELNMVGMGKHIVR